MAKNKSSGGSTLYGILAGLLIGLMVAAAVAYYVVKAPSPFVDKASRSPDSSKPVDPRTAPDPNAGLGGRNAVEGTPVDPSAAAYGAAGEDKSAAKVTAPDDLGALIATLKPTGNVAALAPAPVTPKSTSPRTEARNESSAAGSGGNQTTAGGTFYLQVGSFKVLEDAETLRARLIMKGMPAEIQRAEVNGVQFNRVRVGPFARIDDMNKTRARLGEEKLPSTVVRQ
jgi:cell division protein FtsN